VALERAATVTVPSTSVWNWPVLDDLNGAFH
jgi:hypothetical protein